ncbi:hypothetical protein SCALM49S_03135 [Streptomyces californicus]
MGQGLPVTYVRVVGVERVTPGTARVSFTADELPGLLEDRPDQQMKLCLPRAGQAAPRLEQARRRSVRHALVRGVPRGPGGGATLDARLHRPLVRP